VLRPERPGTGLGLGASPPLMPYSPQMPSPIPREQHSDGWSLCRCPLVPAAADGIACCQPAMGSADRCGLYLSSGAAPPALVPPGRIATDASLPARPQALRAGARDGRTTLLVVLLLIQGGGYRRRDTLASALGGCSVKG
jgi:hypothetical protein